MKYIRTNYGVYTSSEAHWVEIENETLAKADTIEELCDEFVVVFEDKHGIVYDDFEWAKIKANENLNAGINAIIYGAIWTNIGLTYVAKMNKDGGLELI